MSTVATMTSKKVNTLAELLAFLRSRANDLRARYTMTVDGVFGSFARGEQTEDSDVDLLVSFERLPALWDLLGIERDLGEPLGRRVHLVHNDAGRFVEGVRGELVVP